MVFLKVDLELLAKTNMSKDSVLLYSYLKQLKELSVRNNVTDEQGNVVVFCKIEKAMELLSISKPTAVRIFKELVELKLIRRVRRGLTKASYIYINDEDVQEVKKEKVDEVVPKEYKESKEEADSNEIIPVTKQLADEKKNNKNMKKEGTENLFKKIKSVLFSIIQKKKIWIEDSVMDNIAKKIIDKNYRIKHLYHYLTKCIENLPEQQTKAEHSKHIYYNSYLQRNYTEKELDNLEKRLVRNY